MKQGLSSNEDLVKRLACLLCATLQGPAWQQGRALLIHVIHPWPGTACLVAPICIARKTNTKASAPGTLPDQDRGL